MLSLLAKFVLTITQAMINPLQLQQQARYKKDNNQI